jgi:Uncharacterized membrane protein
MKNLSLSLRIAAVFIGTVVGAGLASGQEIIQFFTLYGSKGIIGIILCGILYIITGVITMDLSYKYNAASYRDLIYLSCGKYLGWVIDTLTTFFLFGGVCIILAGSGSIFKETLNLPFLLGIIVMAIVTALVVFYSTDGLLFINSLIVPCMIIITLIICSSVFIEKLGGTSGAMYDITNAPVYKGSWLFSCLLYTSFNMLSATGVLTPMTRDIKKSGNVNLGVVLGSLGLLLLTLIIDCALLLNVPGIFNYSIPMLHLAENTGGFIKGALSAVIWLEMFSTIVSDVYSLSKKMYYNFNVNYYLSVILVLLLAFPFTGLGFANLIKLLYPPFGLVSLVYLLCLVRLHFKGRTAAKL